MARTKVNIPKQSSRESSAESASNAENIGPLEEHLVPPTEERSTGNNDPSTRLLNDSHLQYAAIGTPVPANGQSVDPEESEQTVDRSCMNRCRTFFNWYKNTAIGFRNSRAIHFIHLMFSFIPISAVFMGLIYSHECPQKSSLPILVIATGVLGVIFMSLWITISCCEHQGTTTSKPQKLVLGIFLTLFLIFSVIEMCYVGHLSPNFDIISDDYCNKTFYYYMVGKEIQLAAALTFAALVYLPESGILTLLGYFWSPPSVNEPFFSY